MINDDGFLAATNEAFLDGAVYLLVYLVTHLMQHVVEDTKAFGGKASLRRTSWLGVSES